MSYLSPQTLYEYFTEEGKPLNLDVLTQRFNSGTDVIYPAIEQLKHMGLIEDASQNEMMWKLTTKGIDLWEKQKEQDKIESEKESKENEKLNAELEKLRNELFDYPTTKSRAKWSYNISWVTLAISVAALIISIVQSC